ncbi:MAG TPA: class I SAM-dependent methyltransferase [Propionicimonas sp.]|nr:class I SAM-dependent methyltransferase [Propionicimonas sp.]
MEPVAGARTFAVSGDAYDAFMGRYSNPLAGKFADFAGVIDGQRALDVGCGPGALTGELVKRLGFEQVAACDPSEPFVVACAERHPGVDVRPGSAERVPFDDASFDIAMSQLVLHFVSDPAAAGIEMARVVSPGGSVACCVWNFDEEMQMLRAFWDAALTLDPEAPAEQRVMRFGRTGELSQWLSEAGMVHVEETALTVSSTYGGFDEVWDGFLAGIGPAGSYCTSLPPEHREALRSALFVGLGEPAGSITLSAGALAARGTRR